MTTYQTIIISLCIFVVSLFGMQYRKVREQLETLELQQNVIINNCTQKEKKEIKLAKEKAAT